MTDFKVGDVIVTPDKTLVRLEDFVFADVATLVTSSGYRTQKTTTWLQKECKLATKADGACFKALRLEDLRNEISSLYEDIHALKKEIEEEEKMP